MNTVKAYINKPRTLMTLLTHVIFIVIICVLPEVLIRMGLPERTGGIPWGVYVKAGVMVAVFYINYFFIIPRTLVRDNRWLSFIAWNVLLIVVATIFLFYLSTFADAWHRDGMRPPRPHDHPQHWHRMIASVSFLVRDAVMLILIAGLAVALRLSGKWAELERREEQLTASHRETELEQLRAQINPHFLFNTLNSIYALIAISPPEAQTAVHELSQMLRYVLYDNPERVAVEREVDFLKNYLALMRLRLGDRPVDFTTDIDDKGALVAPMLFVALVENACKYGNTPDRRQPVSIAITLHDGRLTCETVNACDPAARCDSGHGGVGLSNLRRRLELLYGHDASLETSLQDNIFKARLTINLNATSAQMSNSR